MNLDLEFAFTDWDHSCKHEHLDRADRQCRRAANHTGDHASGFGEERMYWKNDGESEKHADRVFVRFPQEKRKES